MEENEEKAARRLAAYSKRKMPVVADFHMIKPISRGAFGKVFLGHRKDNPDRLYAVKSIKKSDIVHKNMVNQLITERDTLAHIKSPFCVQLYYSLQDSHNVYLVMDYLAGGDLKSLVMYGFLEQDLAAFYIAELALALDYLHKHGIVHRDVKPDNLLLDNRGHLKLTDFGLSKILKAREQQLARLASCTPSVVNRAAMRYARTPGQMLSLTSHLSFRSEGESSPANPPPLLGSAAFAASDTAAAACSRGPQGVMTTPAAGTRPALTDLAATAFDTPLTALRDRSDLNHLKRHFQFDSTASPPQSATVATSTVTASQDAGGGSFHPERLLNLGQSPVIAGPKSTVLSRVTAPVAAATCAAGGTAAVTSTDSRSLIAGPCAAAAAAAGDGRAIRGSENSVYVEGTLGVVSAISLSCNNANIVSDLVQEAKRNVDNLEETPTMVVTPLKRINDLGESPFIKSAVYGVTMPSDINDSPDSFTSKRRGTTQFGESPVTKVSTTRRHTVDLGGSSVIASDTSALFSSPGTARALQNKSTKSAQENENKMSDQPHKIDELDEPIFGNRAAEKGKMSDDHPIHKSSRHKTQPQNNCNDYHIKGLNFQPSDNCRKDDNVMNSTADPSNSQAKSASSTITSEENTLSSTSGDDKTTPEEVFAKRLCSSSVVSKSGDSCSMVPFSVAGGPQPHKLHPRLRALSKLTNHMSPVGRQPNTGLVDTSTTSDVAGSNPNIATSSPIPANKYHLKIHGVAGIETSSPIPPGTTYSSSNHSAMLLHKAAADSGFAVSVIEGNLGQNTNSSVSKELSAIEKRTSREEITDLTALGKENQLLADSNACFSDSNERVSSDLCDDGESALRDSLEKREKYTKQFFKAPYQRARGRKRSISGDFSTTTKSTVTPPSKKQNRTPSVVGEGPGNPTPSEIKQDCIDAVWVCRQSNNSVPRPGAVKSGLTHIFDKVGLVHMDQGDNLGSLIPMEVDNNSGESNTTNTPLSRDCCEARPINDTVPNRDSNAFDPIRQSDQLSENRATSHTICNLIESEHKQAASRDSSSPAPPLASSKVLAPISNEFSVLKSCPADSVTPVTAPVHCSPMLVGSSPAVASHASPMAVIGSAATRVSPMAVDAADASVIAPTVSGGNPSGAAMTTPVGRPQKMTRTRSGVRGTLRRCSSFTSSHGATPASAKPKQSNQLPKLPWSACITNAAVTSPFAAVAATDSVATIPSGTAVSSLPGTELVTCEGAGAGVDSPKVALDNDEVFLSGQEEPTLQPRRQPCSDQVAQWYSESDLPFSRGDASDGQDGSNASTLKQPSTLSCATKNVTTHSQTFHSFHTPQRTVSCDDRESLDETNPALLNGPTPRRPPKSVRRGRPPQEIPKKVVKEEEEKQEEKEDRILGTPDYLAPEILLRLGHGPAVDWWAVGVCLFEFLTGLPPFNDETAPRIFHNILNRDIPWPEGDESLSPEAVSTIEQLLTFEPGARATLPRLQQMDFFRNIDWENIHEMTPSFVPQVESATDTFYFEARNVAQDLKVSSMELM